jgi:hypothetical protein
MKKGNKIFKNIDDILEDMNITIGKDPFFKNVTYKAGCAP